MARNGSGTYTAVVNSVNPAVATTTIDASAFNDVLDDLETALTESIARDGQTTTTAVVPFASGIKADTIVENSANTGVTIDGVLIKDGGATFTAAVIGNKGADTASATTVVVGTDGDFFDMTGTTTITGFTVAAGRKVTYQFDGAVLLTHHATNLILPGAANITTAAGDILNLTAYDTDKVYGTFHPADGRAVVGALTLSTAQATTSGTSKDFTSIPAWVKRITVGIATVSGNGTSPLMIQLGTSGSPVATGYSGATASITASPTVSTFTTGFVLSATNAATLSWSGIAVIELEEAASFRWVARGTIGSTGTAAVGSFGGAKTLSAALDMIRFTTVNGTDAFDAGEVNILYE